MTLKSIRSSLDCPYYSQTAVPITTKLYINLLLWMSTDYMTASNDYSFTLLFVNVNTFRFLSINITQATHDDFSDNQTVGFFPFQQD